MTRADMLAQLRAEIAACDDMPEDSFEAAQAMLRELEETANKQEEER